MGLHLVLTSNVGLKPAGQVGGAGGNSVSQVQTGRQGIYHPSSLIAGASRLN